MNKYRRWWSILLGLFVFFVACLWMPPGLDLPSRICLGILGLAAVFWILEPVPIYATSLLVILLQALFLSREGLLPRLGVSGFEGPSYEVFTSTLANPIIILFLGGFMLAQGVTKFGLDVLLTRYLIRPFGQRPAFLLLGMMLVTGLLSAFMSNTATTAMMITMVLPIIKSLPSHDRFRISLALAIPVAANLGGIATPIGTPPNAIVLSALQQQNIYLTFLDWMFLAAPIMLTLLILGWLTLLFLFPAAEKRYALQIEVSGDPEHRGKYRMEWVFGLTILLWLTEELHGIPASMTAFLPIALLPLLGLLGKKDIRSLPWEVLWLVAGGISLGISMQETGLATWIVSQIAWDQHASTMVFLLFAVLTILMGTFLSNTATATLIAPIALGISSQLVGPLDSPTLLMGLLVATSASLGMTLPISTPPNAIAAGSGLVKTKDMAMAGSLIGLLGIGVVMMFTSWIWPLWVK